MKNEWTIDKLIEFEENLFKMFEEGKIWAPVHFAGGNERELIDIFRYIEPRDYVFSTHRSHYHYLLKGGDPQKLIDEILGLPTGVCKGQGRSMHIYDRSINFYTSAIVAGCCSIATGVARSIQNGFKQDDPLCPHVYVFVGDGAEDEGHFAEAIRFSESRKLPITFIIEDNDLSIDSTKSMRWIDYKPIDSPYIIRYNYNRRWPHCGVGRHIEMAGVL